MGRATRLLPLMLGACITRAAATHAVEGPASTAEHQVPPANEFKGRLEVGETYAATLVRALSDDAWLPAPEGSAKPSVRVIWTNPETLSSLSDLLPNDRRIVFEVLSRDLDDPGLFHCQVLRTIH